MRGLTLILAIAEPATQGSSLKGSDLAVGTKYSGRV